MTELSLHIMDIAQNSISAKADLIEIEVTEDMRNDRLTISISDNGCGMDAETAARATDPFFTSRTTRKVGMGLSLLKQAAEQCNGSFDLKSKVRQGTTVTASFKFSHIDRQPMGDIADVIVLLAAANSDIRFVYKHTTEHGAYVFDTKEINEILENVPIANAEVKKYLREMINENLEEIESLLD
jgi:nitrogen fixation/metabolism regulation signal transduction histidine kinase